MQSNIGTVLIGTGGAALVHLVQDKHKLQTSDPGLQACSAYAHGPSDADAKAPILACSLSSSNSYSYEIFRIHTSFLSFPFPSSPPLLSFIPSYLSICLPYTTARTVLDWTGVCCTRTATVVRGQPFVPPFARHHPASHQYPHTPTHPIQYIDQHTVVWHPWNPWNP